jgi:hypothetical protein
MKKIIVTIIIILILVLTTSAIIERIYPNEIESDEPVNLRITLYNEESSNVNNAKVSAYIPYLGVYARSGNTKIRSRRPSKVFLDMDIPKAQPGYYPVILKVENEDGYRKKTHQWVYIS